MIVQDLDLYLDELQILIISQRIFSTALKCRYLTAFLQFYSFIVLSDYVIDNLDSSIIATKNLDDSSYSFA